jgi:hypothetical protein
MAVKPSMRLVLNPHPDTPCPAIERIDVELARPRPDHLTLAYRLTGDIDAIAIPARREAVRADDLWRHTCFEAFLRPDDGEAYVEFNLAPSTAWAVYRFDSYRQGGQSPEAAQPPTIAPAKRSGELELAAWLKLENLIDFERRCRLGLSAVIETTDGAKSYWALAHAPGKPDFHHDDAFAAELP